MNTRKASIYLVRHGETLWNKEKKYLGHCDLGILPQSYETLQPLRDQLDDVDVQLAFSSDLKRCRETALFLKPSLNFGYDSRLRELDFGEFEGQTYEDLKENPTYCQWLEHWESLSPPQGESGEQFKARIEQFIHDLEQSLLSSAVEHTNVLIVTHGGIIRALYRMWTGVATFWEITVPHGTGLQFDLAYDGQQWRLYATPMIIPSRS